MNTRHPPSLLGVLALFTIAAAAPAAGESHRCSQLHDDASRLACYDSAFGKPNQAVVKPAVPPMAAAPLAPSVRAAPVEEVSKPAAGSTSSRRPAQAGSSAIASLKRRADTRFEVTLQNGEVWAQLEPDRNIELDVGDAVTIRSGVLGSFQLVTKVGLTTRVRRVQ